MTQTGSVAEGRLSDWISLGVLAYWVPRDAVDDAVEATGKGAKRKDGKLPPHVMVYFAMALALFAGVISSGDWAVYDVAEAGILWLFAASWTRYLNNVSDADPMQIPLSMLFFEFIGPCVNAVQLHVNDAGPPLPSGFSQT